MDRRTFIGSAAFALVGAASAVHTQTSGNRTIGHLREVKQPIPDLLVRALRDMGWIEGQNLTIEERSTNNREELPALAADLVRRKVDLIITRGTAAVLAAKGATRVIPIVFLLGGNPVQRGLVATMSRPGGNLTGFTFGIYDEKQLQILKATLPAISRVAYPALVGVSRENLLSREAAQALGVEIQHIAMEDAANFAAFFVAVEQLRAEAMLLPDVPRFSPYLAAIGMQASQNRLPAIGYRREFADGGGLASYSPLDSEAYARSALQISKILKGAKAADLPVEQPTRFELVINMRVARALGVSIPRLIRLGADELIE